MQESSISGDGQRYSRVGNLLYRVDGGGLYLDKMGKVTINQKSKFKNLKGRNGGAIYINNDRPSTIALNADVGSQRFARVLVNDVTIENCEAEFNGGAIYLNNPMNVQIQSNRMHFNTAADEGGAIYYDCDPSDIDLLVSRGTPCRLVVDGNEFEGNLAQVGGAIRWNYLEMIIPNGE